MKIFRLLLLVTLGIAVTFVVGCDEAATMVKPVMEDHDVTPKPDTDISTLPVLSETEAREKSRQVMRRLFQRGRKASLAAQTAENGDLDFGNFLKELNNIYIEETGIDLNFVTGTLLPIHKEENLEEAKNTDDSLDNLVEEYVFISFRYPGKSQEELLALFRESARAGNTTVIPERVEALYADLYKSEAQIIIETIVKRYVQRQKEATDAAYAAAGDGDIDSDALMREHAGILFEETGLEFNFVMDTLLAIHLEENLQEADEVLKTEMSTHNLVAEYLRLSFEYPEKSQNELLELFRESARAGNTTVIATIVIEIHGL